MSEFWEEKKKTPKASKKLLPVAVFVEKIKMSAFYSAHKQTIDTLQQATR